MDEAANQFLGVDERDGPLPWLKGDCSQVLSARSMLGEEHRECLGGATDSKNVVHRVLDDEDSVPR